MSLFSRKPKPVVADDTKTSTAVATVAKESPRPASIRSVLIRPHVTEKAGLLSQSGVYTFEVTGDATEDSVIRSIASAYKVTPTRVSILPMRSKTIFARGRRGKIGGGKKAYVYLPKGQTIEFI